MGPSSRVGEERFEAEASTASCRAPEPGPLPYDAILMDVGSTLLEFRPELRRREWAKIIGAEVDAVDAAFVAARAATRPLSSFAMREEYDAYRAEVCSVALDLVAFDGDRRNVIAAMSDAWIRIGWEPFPDVDHVLSELHTLGYRLGVVSNWTASLDVTLAHVGLGHYFDVVACSAAVGAMKPDPRIFRYALNELAIEPGRAMYVGDHHEVDVLGARDAGMDAVLILREETSSLDADATTHIRTLQDLLAVLEARGDG